MIQKHVLNTELDNKLKTYLHPVIVIVAVMSFYLSSLVQVQVLHCINNTVFLCRLCMITDDRIDRIFSKSSELLEKLYMNTQNIDFM